MIASGFADLAQREPQLGAEQKMMFKGWAKFYGGHQAKSIEDFFVARITLEREIRRRIFSPRLG
jgi:hypothetical protein